jgi:choline dehydrogenase-like flavoprotein
VVADLPVGKHLLDHPEGVVTYATSKTITHDETMWVESVLLAESDHVPNGQPELMIWFFSGDFEEITISGGQISTDTNRFSIAPDVAHPKSEGWVRLASTDPGVSPEICFNYFSDPEGYDEALMLEAIKLSRKIATQAPLAGWVAEEVAPGSDLASDDDLRRYLRESTYTAHHPSGTCRMSETDGVVDSQLRVHGVEGLRVADASVFPRMIGLNLCLTVLMVAERCAEFALRDLGATNSTNVAREIFA